MANSSTKLGELIIELGLEDSKFNSGSKALNRELRTIQAQFQNAGAGIKDFGNTLDGLTAKQDMLTRSIDIQKKKFREFEKTYKSNEEAIRRNKEEQAELTEKVNAAKIAFDASNDVFGENAEQTKILGERYKALQKELNTVDTKIKNNVSTMGNAEVNMNKAEASLKEMQSELKQTSQQIDIQSNKWKKLAQDMGGFDGIREKFSSLGNVLSLSLTAPLTAAGVAAVKTSISFDSAFTGVKKTLNTTGLSTKEAEEYFASLKEEIIDMSSRMPQSVEAISAVAEAAGQLGIERENITEFTETMIKLGDSTNIVAEEAASSLAKFANVTKMPQTEFDRLGSTIVALGNNFATTEADIVNMGTRLASAGTQAGLSQAEIMGFATALSSVGLEAEAGGTAFSTFMSKMILATENGGAELEQFASVAGMTADEFRSAFEEDAAGAIEKFLEGLGNAEEKGQSAVKILNEMGITETTLRDALLRAAGASDVFSRAVETGTKAWKDNNALSDEAKQRYETLESQINITKNKLRELADVFGQKLTPFVSSGNDVLQDLIDTVSGLDDTSIQNIIDLGLALASIGPAMKAISAGMGAVKVLKEIKAFMSGAGGIGEALAGAGVGAGTLSAGAWAGIGVAGAFGGIKAGELLQLGGPIDTWVQQQKQKVSQMWQEFSQEQSQNIQQSEQSFNEWSTQFSEQAMGVWNGIVDTTKEIPGKLSESVGQFTEIVGATVTEGWNTIKDATSEKVSEIKDSVSNGFENAKQAVSEKMSGMVSTAGQKFNEMLNNAKQMPAKFKNAATQMGQGLIDGVKSKASRAVTQVKTTATNMYNAAKEKVSNWASIGRSMIEGLVNGIKSMASRAVSAAKSVVESAYNAAKNFLNINSPSRKFIELGKSTTEGFALGISRTASNAVNAVKAMNVQIDAEMRKFLNKNKTLVNNTNTVIDKVAEALGNKYQRAFDKERSLIQQSIDNLNAWKESAIAAANARYEAMVEAIDAEIDALDRAWENKQRKEEDEDINKKISDLKTAIEFEHNEDNKAQMEKELNSLYDQKKDIEEKREYEDAKDALQRQKEELQKQKEAEIAHINAMYEAQKANLDKQMADLKMFYDEKLKQENLQAEAVLMIQNKNQKDIIQLLKDYMPEYKKAGNNLGEQLVAGFKPHIDALKAMIDSIIAQINSAEAAASAAKSKASSITTNNNTTNNTRNVNVTVQRAGSGNDSRDIETALRSVLFSY